MIQKVFVKSIIKKLKQQNNKYKFQYDLIYEMDDDSLFCILNHLDLRDILTCLFVNKQFNRSGLNNMIWKNLFEIKFNNESHNNYYKSYRNYEILKKYFKIDTKRHHRDITRISLDGGHLRMIPPEISSLVNLSFLSLHYNELESLPTELSELTGLRSLLLFGNNFVSIPEVIYSLTNLNDMSLSKNQLRSIPSNISLLTNLEYISFAFNKIETLAIEMFSLTKLKRIQLHNNELVSIPTEIGLLTNLQNLFLDYNKLQSLPVEMSRLTQLERLDVYHNPSEVPNTIFEMPNRIHLYVNERQIKSISNIGSHKVEIIPEIPKDI